MKLYAFKLYDNGVLVRDFQPCMNASETVGLYDLVGKKFYANAGTGVFLSNLDITFLAPKGAAQWAK